ncbi:MAG: phenylacetate--CoA ligase family protein [Alphaproteobacteria bacterium]|nr:phenylacetate--CoA ligase family protein [Alphaproteobacteria bacterium]
MKFPDPREKRDPRERVIEQIASFNEHVAFARMHAPFMRGHLQHAPARISSLQDLQEFPLLRKSDLSSLQKGDIYGGLVAETSKLAHIYRSPGPINDFDGHGEDWWRFARALHAAGIGPGDLVQNCFSYHFTPAGIMFERAALSLGATVFPAGPGQTEAQAEVMHALHVTAYAGVPDFLKIILQKADSLGLDTSYLVKAVVSGGPLFPNVRQWLEERGIAVFQSYGTADLGLVAYESSPESGLIVDEDALVEIVRPGTGEHVEPGEVGEIVVTPLGRREYPLVRFATGDLSAVVEGPGPFGRTNMRLKGWMGRADQTTKVRGMFVHPSQIDQICKDIQARKARAIVRREDGNDVMDIQIVLNEGQNPEDAKLMRNTQMAIEKFLKLKASIDFVSVESLPNDGKIIDDQRDFGAS